MLRVLHKCSARPVGWVPLALMRGGTSKGVFVLDEHLPARSIERDEMLLNIMGSPDPSKMQLNGLGGGISSTSKVAVMKRSGCVAGAVDYLFGQVSLTQATIDWEGACGNLSAAAGLFAKEQMSGEYDELDSHFSSHYLVVPVWQANSKYLMHIHIPRAKENVQELVTISGVPGSDVPILVELINPCKGQPHDLLPTGNVKDSLQLLNGKEIESTLIFAANPTVFVNASCLGLSGTELPAELDYENTLSQQVSSLLEQAAGKMGIQKSSALRLCWVSPPKTSMCTDGSELASSDLNIVSRITTEGRVHHAHTATGALNLGIAASIPGTVPQDVCTSFTRELTIGHPAGSLGVTATVVERKDVWYVETVGLVRTARTLLCGIAPTGVDTDK